MFPRVRELIGWLFVAGGLLMIYTAVQFVETRKPFEGGVMVMASAVMIRTGMHLVRMSVAGQICLLRQNTDQSRAEE